MIKDVDENTLLARERTILASERTFLAWTRTGLACVGGGLAIIRFMTFQSFSHILISQVLGSLLVLLGVAIFSLSYLDFRNSSKKYNVMTGYAGSLLAITIMTFVLVFISIFFLFIAFKFHLFELHT